MSTDTKAMSPEDAGVDEWTASAAASLLGGNHVVGVFVIHDEQTGQASNYLGVLTQTEDGHTIIPMAKVLTEAESVALAGPVSPAASADSRMRMN